WHGSRRIVLHEFRISKIRTEFSGLFLSAAGGENSFPFHPRMKAVEEAGLVGLRGGQVRHSLDESFGVAIAGAQSAQNHVDFLIGEDVPAEGGSGLESLEQCPPPV